jgi:hypothetical protein
MLLMTGLIGADGLRILIFAFSLDAYGFILMIYFYLLDLLRFYIALRRFELYFALFAWGPFLVL